MLLWRAKRGCTRRRPRKMQVSGVVALPFGARRATIGLAMWQKDTLFVSQLSAITVIYYSNNTERKTMETL